MNGKWRPGVPADRRQSVHTVALFAAVALLPALLFWRCGSTSEFERKQRVALKQLSDATGQARRGNRDADGFFAETCSAFLLLDDRYNEIRCLIAHGNLKIKLGQNRAARELLGRALELSERAAPQLRADILSAQILLFIREGQQDEAMALCQEALKLKTGSASRKQILAHRGYLHFARAQDTAALQDFRAASGSGDAELESYVQIHLARSWARTGRFQEAEDAARTALKLDHQAARPDLLAFDYEILGQIAQGRGQNQQARENYGRALDMYRALGERRRVDRLVKMLRELP